MRPFNLLTSWRIAVIAAAILCLSMPQIWAKDSRITQSFDDDWSFQQGDLPGVPITLAVPHDWSIAGPFSEANKTGGAGGFLPSGVCWYRKTFSIPKDWQHKRILLEFDGVMQNSDVWVNGVHLGHRPNGYVNFRYELPSDSLHFGSGGTNIIAVRCDTSAQPASRWYSGAGIYRHVRLVITDAVHLAEDGVFVNCESATAEQAVVRVQSEVVNSLSEPRTLALRTILFDPLGGTAGDVKTNLTLPPGTTNSQTLFFVIKRPKLWSLDSPNLYTAQTTLEGARSKDIVRTTFGIRDAHFEPETGFWLNGKNFKIKGVCLHHDGGAFGAAVPLSIWEDRLAKLKSIGVNAIRTAHNPPDPGFLNLCDRMGFLVMDEFFDCWTVAKNPYDYHLYFKEWAARDAADTVRRDRNHPSVITYSVGNEIHDTPMAAMAKKILSGLVAICHTNDPTRPVTQALFRPNVSGDYTNGLAELLDLVGQNYREKEILAANLQVPTRKILGTENQHDRLAWVAMRDHAPYSGQFIWTGIDYLGESRNWPVIGHQSGLLDRTGRMRSLARERQSWWQDSPVVHIARRIAANDMMPTDPGYGGEERHRLVLFSDWTPRQTEPQTQTVEAFSNCEEVELFLNGKSLGTQPIHPDAMPRVWKIDFVSGELKAVARNGGKIVASQTLRTAGSPASIQLTSQKTRIGGSWDDVAIVRATVVDSNGIPVPRAENLFSFEVHGPGIIAAVDNGDNESLESFHGHERKAFLGECVAYVKSNGKDEKPITVSASANGLKTGTLELVAVAGKNTP